MFNFPLIVSNIDEYYQTSFKDYYNFIKCEKDKFFINYFILKLEFIYDMMKDKDFSGLTLNESEDFTNSIIVSYKSSPKEPLNSLLETSRKHLQNFLCNNFLKGIENLSDGLIFDTFNKISDQNDRYNYYRQIIKINGFYNELHPIIEDFINAKTNNKFAEPMKTSILNYMDYPLYINDFISNEKNDVYRVNFFDTISEKLLLLHFQAIFFKFEELYKKNKERQICIDSSVESENEIKIWFKYNKRVIDGLLLKTSEIDLYNSGININFNQENIKDVFNSFIPYIHITNSNINKKNIEQTFNSWAEKKIISENINKNFHEYPLKTKRL